METLNLIIGSGKSNSFICKHNNPILVNHLGISHNCYLCVIEAKYHIDIDNSKYKHIGIENKNSKDIITLEPW